MTKRARLGLSLPFVAAAVLAAGCASTGRPYLPHLASVRIPVGDDGEAATALVSIQGPVAGAKGMPKRIEVGLRLENHTERPLTLAARDLELVGTDLRSFGRPELTPAGPVRIAAGEQTTLRAAFALPPELKSDAETLRALNLRVSLEAGGRAYASAVTFDRMEREPIHSYAPYEYGYWPYPGPPVFVAPEHHHPHHRG